MRFSVFRRRIFDQLFLASCFRRVFLDSIGTVFDWNGTSITKSEYVSKTEKNEVFLQQMCILFQNSVFGEIQFYQKSVTHGEKQTPFPSKTRP